MIYNGIITIYWNTMKLYFFIYNITKNIYKYSINVLNNTFNNIFPMYYQEENTLIINNSKIITKCNSKNISKNYYIDYEYVI